MSTEILRVSAKSAAGVDREKNVILGYVVAQEGPFKTPGRGEFDKKSLRAIVSLMNAHPRGLKSRFTHPVMGDGLGRFLGRAKNPRREKMMVPMGDGTFKEIEAVRADLYLDPVSFDTPFGNLGKYVMDLAESDPDAFGSSLALSTEYEVRLKANGTPELDANGEPLPPLWRPVRLAASDVVEDGEAVTSFLSVMPGVSAWQAAAALAKACSATDRETLRAQSLAHLDDYLEQRFGKDEDELSPAQADKNKRLRLEIDLRRRRNA